MDLRLPSRELRTPRVALRVERDGLALIVLARRRRREGGMLEVSLPETPDGEPAVLLPEAEHAELVAPVRAHPDAWRCLAGR
ncbi:MAG: hypothetical protein NZM27_03950 [Acetobacteraceae bacterium]|nr:hypothetical protein [Acetobacteraceae bacterium]